MTTLTIWLKIHSMTRKFKKLNREYMELVNTLVELVGLTRAEAMAKVETLPKYQPIVAHLENFFRDFQKSRRQR